MSRMKMAGRLVLVMSVVMTMGIAGCGGAKTGGGGAGVSGGSAPAKSTKKMTQEEKAKLEEARTAAESAERKLSELRQERMGLESELENGQQ